MFYKTSTTVFQISTHPVIVMNYFYFSKVSSNLTSLAFVSLSALIDFFLKHQILTTELNAMNSEVLAFGSYLNSVKLHSVFFFFKTNEFIVLHNKQGCGPLFPCELRLFNKCIISLALNIETCES